MEEIPNYPDLPTYYQTSRVNSWNTLNRKGFYALTFSSSLNLDVVVQSGNMRSIFYYLKICGMVNFFFRGPLFPYREGDIEDLPYIDNAQTFYYVAYLPIDYQDRDKRYSAMYHPDMSQEIQQYGVCFEIGAGAMGGAKLKSNSLEIDF